LRTQCKALLAYISSHSTLPYIETLSQKLDELDSPSHGLTDVRGLIRGLQAAYDDGMLESIAETIEANVTADYLGQAQQLLKEGVTGNFEHIPAAVLTGAIFEDSLRRLCVRNTISLLDAKGNSKTLNPMIEDLKKANLYNELKAKQLRAWADIRNAAAHGEFTKFNKQDVEAMLIGVQNFLADYL
jgi:hypothetical protein